MASIRGKDTAPERALRQALHAAGIRFRKHARSVPGTPDLSVRKHHLAIFVDGCFWHGCPTHYRLPGKNTAFWQAKIERNRLRRERVLQELGAGWTTIEVWECELPERTGDIVQQALVATGRANHAQERFG